MSSASPKGDDELFVKIVLLSLRPDFRVSFFMPGTYAMGTMSAVQLSESTPLAAEMLVRTTGTMSDFRSASLAGSGNSTLQTNLDCIFGLQKNSAAARLAKFFFTQIC